MALDPFMKQCIHAGCSDPPQWEHSLIYQGKQVNEAWAIVPACKYHHMGEGLDKNYNRAVALYRATDEDLDKYPKTDWKQQKIWLVDKYKKELKKLFK